MQKYFDLSERERANLTEEQVQAFCAIALMEAGIAKPFAPPSMAESIRDLKVNTIIMWKAGKSDILFRTREQAVAFLELQPFELGYEYEIGYDFKFPKPMNELPEAVTAYEHDDVRNKSAEIKKYKEKKDEIERAVAAYKAQVDKTHDATKGIWGDWYELRGLGTQYEKVIETKTEYEKLTGDPAIAETFLRKTFGDKKVDAALAWFGVGVAVAA